MLVVHLDAPTAGMVVRGGAPLALAVVQADAMPCNDVEYDPHESHDNSFYSPHQGSPLSAFSRIGPSYRSSSSF